MPVPVHRLTLSLLLASAALVGTTSPAPVAAQSCDPNYGITAGGCVPGDRDYDCGELHARSIGDIPVIGSDWQRLDGYFDHDRDIWLSYPDGLGCEWYGE
jgi:hypothetical protein